ncbi:MAG: hypothetical protein R3Y18_02860 [Bacillota bacterium]
MRNIFGYIKGINNIKDQQDLSEVLEKVTQVVDDKLMEVHKEQQENALEPVIIKDEDGNFIDCCNIVKSDAPMDYFALASVVLKGITEVEKDVRGRLKKISLIFYTVLMSLYIMFTLSHLNDIGNKTVVLIFFILFGLLFVVMTFINVIIYKNTKQHGSETARQIKVMKNYRSVAVILRRGMLLWSLGITIYSMIITWEQGPAYQFLNIIMLIVTSCILMYVIYREVRKVSQRSQPKEAGRIKVVFNTMKNAVNKSKTADILTSGELKIEAPKENKSEFIAKLEERKNQAKSKKQVKRNSYEIKKSYKENYKNELKKLKEKYLDDIDNL